MPQTTLHYSKFFPGSPERIFRILTNAELHSELIQSDAKIKPVVGSTFSMWGGSITGLVQDLVPDAKIVLFWRSDEVNWPMDTYSKITIVLQPVDGGTQLEFDQENIPEKCLKGVDQGWQDYYFSPLQEMLDNENEEN